MSFIAKSHFFGDGRERDFDVAIIDGASSLLGTELNIVRASMQLWEYRIAATVARATNRTFCMEPAMRFYLTTSGELLHIAGLGYTARAGAVQAVGWLKAPRFNV